MTEAGYANRAGIKQPCIYSAIVVMHKYYEHCVEKWALCYRHYDHSGVNTNMLVERYNT